MSPRSLSRILRAVVVTGWAVATTAALGPALRIAPCALAQDYRYNPENKVDPFLPIQLKRATILGLSRLQDYEIVELELVGTVLGSEITALILTPAPPEGVLAKIGDRVGRKGGRIIAISREKVVVREPASGTLVPGRTQKFNDVTMVLSSRTSQSSGGIRSNREAERMGFPSLVPPDSQVLPTAVPGGGDAGARPQRTTPSSPSAPGGTAPMVPGGMVPGGLVPGGMVPAR